VVGYPVVVADGGTDIFGGSIDEVQERKMPGDTDWLRFHCRCVGYEQLLDKRFITTAVYGRMPFTVDADTDTLTTAQIHLFYNGYPVEVASEDTLPGGLSAATTYYVINRSDTTLQLSATKGGAAINITDVGVGEHRILWMTGGIVQNILVWYINWTWGITPTPSLRLRALQPGPSLTECPMSRCLTITTGSLIS